MANITQISTSNTFGQWVTGTQAIISKLNSLTDGGNSQIFYANTNIEISNNVTISGNLTVSGNLTLDSIGFDDIVSNGSGYFANSVTAGVSISTPSLSVNTSANIQTLTGQSGNFANSSFNHANSSFIQANSGFSVANSASIYANGAFTKANTALDSSVAFAIALG